MMFSLKRMKTVLKDISFGPGRLRVPPIGRIRLVWQVVGSLQTLPITKIPSPRHAIDIGTISKSKEIYRNKDNVRYTNITIVMHIT